ncbi:MAG: 30S ribosome-binding factor RbfA, partial [Clostridia bacterium]
DLKFSKVYISMLNIENKVEALKVINNASGFFRNELKVLMNIRNIPELAFYIDDSIEYGMKIDKLLKEISEKEISKDD